MATFTILIKGLALAYGKDRNWEVILPFEDCNDPNNDCHKVAFFDFLRPEVLLASPNTEITFSATGLMKNFGTGADYGSLINITAAYSHRGGVEIKAGWQSLSAFMVIPEAILSVEKLSKCRYQLERNGTRTFGPSTVGHVAKAVITADSLTININGKPFQTYNTDWTLIIDNNCYQYKPMNYPPDFNMLYCIMKPKLTSEGICTVKRDPTQLPRLAILRDEGPTFKRATSEADFYIDEDSIETSAFDFDLIKLLSPGDPEPEEYGLPCHVVVADPAPSLP